MRRWKSRFWALTRPGFVWAATVTVIGLALTASVAFTAHTVERRNAESVMDRHAELVRTAVQAEIQRYIDTLEVTAAGLGGPDQLDLDDFLGTTTPLVALSLRGATAISFIAHVDGNDIAEQQRYWRARGARGLRLQSNEESRQHLFNVFTRPLNETPPAPLGIDLSAAREPAEALNEARRSGRPALSAPYHLLRDRALPIGQRELSFVLTAPVHVVDETGGRGRFRGWALMGLRSHNFLDSTLDRVSEHHDEITLLATREDGRQVEVTTLQPDDGERSDLVREVLVPLPTQNWVMRIRTSSRTIPGGSSQLDTAALVGGTALTGVLAVLVFVLVTAKSRAQARVVSATADLRAAEDRAKRQATLLEAVLESVSDGVAAVDADGRFILQNTEGRTLVGVDDVPEDSAAWPSYFGIYHVDGVTPLMTDDMPLMRTAVTGEPITDFEMVIRNSASPDGRVLRVSTSPLLHGGKQSGAVAVYHDVTEQKRLEAEMRDELARRTAAEAEAREALTALADQKAYLTQVLDAIDVTVFTCDINGNIVHFNRTATQFSDEMHTSPSIIDRTGEFTLIDEHGEEIRTEDQPLARALRGEHIEAMRVTVSWRGGNKVMLIAAVPLRDAAGRLTGAVSSAYDITELQEREHELMAFAHVVAHDLRSPLTAVRGFADLVREEITESLPAGAATTAVEGLDRISAAAGRMSRLIDDLLVYATARNKDLNLTDFDLRDVVRDVVTARVDEARGAAGQPVPDIFVGTLPQVRGDQVLIRQLFTNLIGNAVKYTQPGRQARVDISAEKSGDWVLVQVADRGVGIPAGEHEAIFASFHRAHSTGYTGTGLGLAICHRIVTRHGGEIVAEDRPGGGARFTFSIPAAGRSVTEGTEISMRALPG